MGNPSAASNALGIIAHGPASAGVAGSSQSTRSLASYRVSPREGVYPYDIPYDSACFRGGAGGDVDAFIGGGDANGRPPRNGVSARASSARVPSAPHSRSTRLSAPARTSASPRTSRSNPPPLRPRALSSSSSGVAVDAPLAPLAPSHARSRLPARRRRFERPRRRARRRRRRQRRLRRHAPSLRLGVHLRRRRRFKFPNFAFDSSRRVRSSRRRAVDPTRRTPSSDAIARPRAIARSRARGVARCARRASAATRRAKMRNVNPVTVFHTRVSEHIPAYIGSARRRPRIRDARERRRATRAAIDKSSAARSRGRDVARASSTSTHARARRRDADALDERRANGRRPAPRRETTRASDASDATRSIDHRAAIERNERTRDARGANARARGRGRRC